MGSKKNLHRVFGDYKPTFKEKNKISSVSQIKDAKKEKKDGAKKKDTISSKDSTNNLKFLDLKNLTMCSSRSFTSRVKDQSLNQGYFFSFFAFPSFKRFKWCLYMMRLLKK